MEDKICCLGVCVVGVLRGADFSGCGDEPIFVWWGDSPIPPSGENPAHWRDPPNP